MKQIFEWLREQMHDRIKWFQTMDTTDVACDVAIKETERFIEYINEAEAKWEAAHCTEGKELIDKDKMIDWSYREPTYHDSMNDRTDMRDFINSLPTTTEAEIRAMAIDEFAEKLEAELLDAKRVLSERREMQERESEMAKMCSYNIGVLNAVGSMMGEIAEQLKEE